MEIYRKSYKRKPRKCPECGHRPLANIMYGMPLMDKALEENLEKGLVTLGGCCDAGLGPEWKCSSCDKEFYKIHKHDTFIRFRLDQYMSGFTEFIYDGYHSSIELGFGYFQPIKIERESVAKLMDLLLEVDVFSWDKEYMNHNILDGMGWELEVNIDGKYIKSSGINSYPNGFDEIRDAVEKLIRTSLDAEELPIGF